MLVKCIVGDIFEQMDCDAIAISESEQLLQRTLASDHIKSLTFSRLGDIQNKIGELKPGNTLIAHDKTLSNDYVFYFESPQYFEGSNACADLRSIIKSILNGANKNKIQSLGLSATSLGVQTFPQWTAAKIIVEELNGWENLFPKSINIVIQNNLSLEIFNTLIDSNF